jgi:hypothetical protein
LNYIEKLYELSKKNVTKIICGDFNCVEVNDKIKDNKSIKNHEKVWSEYYKDFELLELLGINKLPKPFTWSSGNNCSRIDRIYVSVKDKINYVDSKYTKLLDPNLSDHKLVIGDIYFQNQNIKNKSINEDKSWKLNESILKDDDVKIGIKKICDDIPKFKLNKQIHWYDAFISEITSYLKKISFKKNNIQKIIIKHYLEEILAIKNLDVIDEYYSDRLKYLDSKINLHYINKSKAAEQINKNNIINFVNCPTKTIIRNEAERKDANKIKNIIINNSITNDDEPIINAFHNFYENILGKKNIDEQNLNKYQFITESNLSNDDNQILDNPFTFEEISEIISNMSYASPGPNGLTIGFFKEYFSLFGKHYVELINSNSNLPDQFLESVIRLIPKNKNKNKEVGDFRPISITNYDYRIFSKALVNRTFQFLHL